jgi:enamine deaminase RidA (YjgF/YER057c/UK114 family)
VSDIAFQEKALTQMHRIQPAGLPSPKRAYAPRRVFDEGAYPARTTVQVAALGRPEFDVELSAVARLA